MLAFGQIVLPIAALIAVGLLFVGIKLFFLTPPNRGGVEVIAGAENIQEEKTNSEDLGGGKSKDIPAVVATVKSEEKKTPQPKQNVVLAGPVDPTKPVKPAKGEQKPAAAKPATTKPSTVKPAVTNSTATGAKPAQTASKPATKIETTSTAKPTTTQAQKKPETIPAKTPTTAKAGSKWGVQIGAFTKEEGAQTLSAQAKKDGYATSISATDSSGTKYYRVRVSAGDTKEKAEKLAAELEKKGYPVAVFPMQ